MKRAEPHRAAAAPAEMRHWKGSAPCPPARVGRAGGKKGGLSCPDSHEPPCRDEPPLRRPRDEPGHGTRGERSRGGRSGALPRRTAVSARRRHEALPREWSRTRTPLPRPRPCFLLGRPLPASPRPPARCPIPSPRRGRGAGGGGARAARPHSPPGGRLRPPASSGGGGSSSGSRRVPETEAREEVRHACRADVKQGCVSLNRTTGISQTWGSFLPPS
ncbi:translation initiation factor IF-2-like [Pyrgilauda ruficollis]|uniref:translation initiation factor IF-2-like n=1 Tax=Pyrgilauda ruficollis TaxID=221976 RepID=UPI001B87AC4D|nr:translation initiation factor IF-2-like [Pyrgilauda ruficollis]XP_041335741.1 translation initiation factor IF-2-like [Pyrgilauda ruficollis]XP_041335742.1 translation initiation factor IF-2-like [Pyrgilauda ruficollis]